MTWYELAADLTPALRSGNLADCAERVISALNGQPDSPFHIVTRMTFTNSRPDVAAHFDQFIREQGPFAAVYTETNGFDINPDRWYFDVFGYRQYGGTDDIDWLAYWDSSPFPEMPLTGMEELQRVFASPAFGDAHHREAGEYASLLVVIRFQQLVRESAPMMEELSGPLLATSHDYDFIYEFRPGGAVTG